MTSKDIWILALRNLKAGFANVVKIAFGIGCAFMLINCFVGVASFFITYKNNFEKDYKNSCYYYKEIDHVQKLSDALNNVSLIGQQQAEYGACESSYMLDIGIIDLNENYTPVYADELEVHINDKVYYGKNYFVAQRNHYQNIVNAKSEIYLGYYSKEVNYFPTTIFSEGCNYVGRFPTNEGEIMLDDYFLKVYGIENKPENLIGATVSLYVQKASKEIICKNYTISGILSAEELTRREDEEYHDSHLEHIYINVKDEDIEKFAVVYGSSRFYFENYTDLVKNYRYSSELLSMQFNSYASEVMEYHITSKGGEICILTWIMNNMGKLLLFMAVVVVFVIFFSLFYIIRFYFRRNEKYMSMLACIGMKQSNRRKLRNCEMFIMLIGAELIGMYMTNIFFVIFRYITSNLLSYAFSVCPITLLVVVIVSFVLVWGYKELVIRIH